MSDNYKNKIITGNCLEELKKLTDNLIDMCITSPPYYGLRSYGTKPAIWDADPNCKHEWGDEMPRVGSDYRNHRGTLTYRKTESISAVNEITGGNFCVRCGAWRGELGNEPHYSMYVEHLLQIFDEVMRVMKPTGTCWVNIGDSYAGSGGNGYKQTFESEDTFKGKSNDGELRMVRKMSDTDIRSKSLCDIPHRFSIGMIDRGWIKRNTIIWHKRNCLPQSCKDRFTEDFEYLFFFVKSNDVQFWQHKKTKETVTKRPQWETGEEGRDWQWRVCYCVENEGRETKILREDAEKMGSPRARYHRGKEEVCKYCNGAKKFKVSLWRACDYWFEQQLVPVKEESLQRAEYGWHGQLMEDGTAAGGSTHSDKIGSRWVNKDGANMRAVWSIATRGIRDSHFAVFPQRLIEIPINAGCPEDGLILDPFFGSGTTGIYARKANRNYLGIELNAEYVKVAEKRMYKELGMFQ